jgi:hypothetical protein
VTQAQAEYDEDREEEDEEDDDNNNGAAGEWLFKDATFAAAQESGKIKQDTNSYDDLYAKELVSCKCA